MKRAISIIASLSLLLSACANLATQAQLDANRAACATGDPDACTAAQYTAVQAQQEAQANATAAAAGIAAIGGAVAIGVSTSNNGGGYYHNYRYHR